MSKLDNTKKNNWKLSYTLNSVTILLKKLDGFRLIISQTISNQSPGLRGEGNSRELWIGVCRQGSWTLTYFRTKKAKTDTLSKAQTRKMTSYSRKKIVNSMKRKTLFLFCNIVCMNDIHINNVAFSYSSIMDRSFLWGREGGWWDLGGEGAWKKMAIKGGIPKM